MRVRSDGAGNQRAGMEQIESGRHELAELIPKERQIKEWRMRGEDQRGEQDEENCIDAARYRTARFAPLLNRHPYCTMPPPDCGSSLISPKVFSYWETFCCNTFKRALACCG